MNITLLLVTVATAMAFLFGLFAHKRLRFHRPSFAPFLSCARRFAIHLLVHLRAALAYSARLQVGYSPQLSIICLAFALCLAPPARAQLTPVNYVNCISNVTSLAAGVKVTASNAVAAGVAIRQGKGVSIMASVGATNASGLTTNLTVFWQVTQDGTNWSSLPAFSTTHNIQGTTNWISYTNIIPDILNNVARIRPLQWTNAHTDTVWFTNIMVGTSAGP